MSNVLIPNTKIQNVLAQLRELGQKSVPGNVLLQMVKVQSRIIEHIEAVQATNLELIKQYGEEDKEHGGYHVTPEMDGWPSFQQEAQALNLAEFDAGEPFVLYQREQDGEIVIGWTDPVKTPLALSPNILVDVGDIVVVDTGEEEEEEGQVVGHIGPEENDPTL
jgi:hypothetical protein